MFPNSFTSPALFSTILNLAAGLCSVLAIFLAIVAFSVTVSLTIVYAVHVIAEALTPFCRGPHVDDDVEAGSTGGGGGGDGSSGTPAVHNSRQIVELLDRIIRSVREGRSDSMRLDEERRREAVQRLPPKVCYGFGLSDCSVKECVICLDEFEADDLCQLFPVCNHVFHSSCIGNWLEKNPSCPLCRTCILETPTQK